MGAVADGDIIRCTVKMSYNAGADAVQNVYHLRMVGGPEADGVVWSAIAAQIEDAYLQVQAKLSNTLAFDTIECWNVTQDSPMGEAAWPTLTGGTGASNALPQQDAALVLFNTLAPRSQGRKYIGFFTEGDNEGTGVMSASLQTALANFATYILDQVVGSGFYLTFGNWNPTLARFAQFVGAVVSDVWKTQRRRTRGHGT